MILGSCSTIGDDEEYDSPSPAEKLTEEPDMLRAEDMGQDGAGENLVERPFIKFLSMSFESLVYLLWGVGSSCG